MEKVKKIFKKANDGSVKTVAIVGAICIALMLSVGITLAQQTQETKMVNAVGSVTATTDCVYCTPQRPSGGGMKTEGQMVCPLAIGGITQIQDMGQSWYEDAVAQGGVIYNPHQNKSLPQGMSVIFNGGRHGISQPIDGYWAFPMTWAQLTERFAIVEAFNEGTGPVPYWWNAAENYTYTQVENCNALSNCLISSGVEPYWAYVLMGFIVVDGNPYYYVPFVIQQAGAGNQQAVINCLHNAGVI